MYMYELPFGQGENYIDSDEKNASLRIGYRIRTIRTSLGLTQAELGERVNLPAERIQRYESGNRKPKKELLKKLADAMGVEAIAFTDPVVSTEIGAMYALFEMQKEHKLKIERDEDGFLRLYFGNGKYDSINGYLDEWEKENKRVMQKIEEAANNLETFDQEKEKILHDYDMWMWSFPQPIVNKTKAVMEEAEIKKEIEKREKEIEELKKRLSSKNE